MLERADVAVTTPFRRSSVPFSTEVTSVVELLNVSPPFKPPHPCYNFCVTDLECFLPDLHLLSPELVKKPPDGLGKATTVELMDEPNPPEGLRPGLSQGMIVMIESIKLFPQRACALFVDERR